MPTDPSTIQNPKVTGLLRHPKKGIPRWVKLIVVITIVGLSWFGWIKTHPSGPTQGLVITGTVKHGDLIETVSATGSIAAQTGAEVKIGSQITGRIKRLYADVGDVVKAGEVIAELDLPDVDAQLDQAKANHASAQSKLVQQQQNVTLSESQTQSSISVARANLVSAKERLKSAQALGQQQVIQTPVDIKKAEAGLKQASATFASAQSSYRQVQAGANLQIQNSQDAVTQAKATDANNQIDLKRQVELLARGYIAQKVVDQSKQAATNSQAQVQTSLQTLELTKQKVAADLQTSKDQVTLAAQGLETAKANLDSAKAGTYTTTSKIAAVADAKAGVSQAQATLQQAIGNLTTNSVRAQDVQQARDAVTQAQAQIAVNQAQVDKTMIKTPISGTVIQLATQQGETLAAGLSAPTLIIVADLKRLEVDAYVDETDIGKVKIGQPVQISVDAFPDIVLKGKVAKVASGSTIQQGVVTYEVKVFFDKTSIELKPDMTASVTIETGRQSNVLVLPSVAIQVGVKGSSVKVMDTKDGKSTITSVKVKTGGTDGVNTEILSGLKEGQTIVLAGGRAAPTQTSSSSPFGTVAGGSRGGGGGGPPGGGGGGRGGG